MLHSATAVPLPFTCHNGGAPAFPVLLSVPHAGRDYPADLLANLRVPPAELVRLEDRYADRLVQPAIAAGFPVIVAQRARAWIDLNRAESDVDSGMFRGGLQKLVAAPGPKTRGGLGLFPRRLQSCGELWRTAMLESEAVHRIEQLHRPYHAAIANLLNAMRDRFGFAVLIDVHSMPPLSGAGGGSTGFGASPQIVVGDRFGRSAATLYAELVLEQCARRGWKAGLNSPYSGDHILQTHGQPRKGVHALQLEIDRSLYLDDSLREPSANLVDVAALVMEIATDIASANLGSSFAEAAE